MTDKQISKSATGKILGRPRRQGDKPIALQTRVPTVMRKYLKQLAVVFNPTDIEVEYWNKICLGKFGMEEQGTQIYMYKFLFSRFLADKPWNAGLKWRTPKSTVTFADGESQGNSGWDQMNVQVYPVIADRINEVATMNQVSVASVVYSALYWFTMYVYPPKV